MFNFHSDNEVIVLMEAILDRIKEDYRLLWYIKNNVKNGGNYLFTNDNNRNKKDDEIRLAGCVGSVNSELIKMEEYLKDIFPNCADQIIKYLRETSANKITANKVKYMKISA